MWRRAAWPGSSPAGRAGRVEGLASAPNSLTIRTLPLKVARSLAIRATSCGRSAAAARARARTSRRSSSAPIASTWRYSGPGDVGGCVPQTSTATSRPGSQAMQLARHGVDVGGLAAVVAVAGDLVGEVPGDDRRVHAAAWTTVSAHARGATCAAARRVRGPGAGRVDRADALPDEDAGGVEALEQRGAERVLGARRVGADRLQLARRSRPCRRAQRVAAPAARPRAARRRAGAARRPLSSTRPPTRRSSRRPTRASTRTRRGHRGAGRTGRVSRGSHSAASATPRARGPAAASPGARRTRREAQRGARRRGAACRARAIARAPRAVAHADADVDDRAPPRPGACASVGALELAGAERAERHLAVDAAEVEPRAMPAVALHRATGRGSRRARRAGARAGASGAARASKGR